MVVVEKKQRILILGVVASCLILILGLIGYMSGRNVYFKAKMDKRIVEIQTDSVKLINDQDNMRKELLVKLENNLRHQMRLDLESAGKLIEESVASSKFNSRDDLISFLSKEIHRTTVYNRTFNNDGDWFSLISIGSEMVFNMDEALKRGQPLYNGKPIISYPGRNRTRYDEIVWQDEAKAVLAAYGVINRPKYIPDVVNLPNIERSYKVDDHLNNVEVYTNNDIEYLIINYPKIYNHLKEFGIIMHYNTAITEKVLNFISYNRSTVYGDNLYWYIDKPADNLELYKYDTSSPDKEILEVYVIPSGVYGFFGEPKMLGGGVFNRNYVKISLVSSCKLIDYLKTYDKELNAYELAKVNIKANTDRTVRIIRDSTQDALNINWFYMFIVSITFLICVITSLYFYTRIPYSLLDSSVRMCTYECQSKRKDKTGS